jgi:2,4-dienoyl-CoA reductase-like NADH-dependent reductase (Old Yellow Enzyme family)
VHKMAHERFHFKDRSALEQKIAELALDIPLADDISVLFSPVSVAQKTLPNRFVVLPLEGVDADASGGPSGLTLRRYLRFAQGGAGLIWFEATSVSDDGRSHPGQLRISPRTKDAFKRLVEKTRQAAQKKFGPGHTPLLVLQLTHSGRFAQPEGKFAPVIAQHNAVLDDRMGLPPDYPLISDAALDALQEVYVSAAALASEAGFDGVDIKACHGYLVSELLASFTRRGSRYGGPLENRIRFLEETVRKTKEMVRGLFITSRLSLFDGVPYPYGFGVDRQNPEKEDLSEPIELVGRLARLGYPLLGISLGIPGHRPHYGRPYDKPLIGQELPEEHPLAGVARWLRLTAQIQKTFPALPIVGAGFSWLRQFFPHAAAAMVQTQKAALIGLGREALAYPDWVNDLAERGVVDPRKVCLTCSKCSQMLRAGSRVGCAVRDAKIYQPEYREVRKKAREAWRKSKKISSAESKSQGDNRK